MVSTFQAFFIALSPKNDVIDHVHSAVSIVLPRGNKNVNLKCSFFKMTLKLLY